MVTVDGEPMLSCTGSGPAFAAAAMAGGVTGVAEEGEVAAALEALAKEAGIDAPTELRRHDVADAEWIVLGRSTDAPVDELVVGVGSWSRSGPGPGGQYVFFDRSSSGWRASGWGDCNLLAPVLPPGQSWVEVIAAPASLDPTATSIEVELQERECTSGRDPGPFLNEPVVVERDDAVTVYWTSDSPDGDQTCPGNPSVTRALELDQPLGERQLLDGSTWPPKSVPAP